MDAWVSSAFGLVYRVLLAFPFWLLALMAFGAAVANGTRLIFYRHTAVIVPYYVRALRIVAWLAMALFWLYGGVGRGADDYEVYVLMARFMSRLAIVPLSAAEIWMHVVVFYGIAKRNRTRTAL